MPGRQREFQDCDLGFWLCGLVFRSVGSECHVVQDHVQLYRLCKRYYRALCGFQGLESVTFWGSGLRAWNAADVALGSTRCSTDDLDGTTANTSSRINAY